MFTKLLKHDSRAIFKYWWIGAVVSLGISVLGGVCIQIIDIDYTSHRLIPVLAGIGLFFSIVGMVLLPLFTEILILVRYYKNFFTDEGYLTFTLPVKRTQLLDSKLLTALIFNIGSILLFTLDIMLMLSIGIPEHFFSAEGWKEFFEIIGDLFRMLGGYSVPYILLGILIILALALIQSLFVFACITFASSVVKKHKILMSIGVYYGANMSLSFVYQILMFGGMPTVFTLIGALNRNNSLLAVMMILIGVLGICAVVAGGLYLLVLYLLDRRLNLE